MKPLTKRELAKIEKDLSEWSLNSKETQLTRTFKFDKHIDGLIFMARVTVHAEVNNHHPDMEYSHAKVKVKLTTHELKALTKIDVKLAKKIDKLFVG